MAKKIKNPSMTEEGIDEVSESLKSAKLNYIKEGMSDEKVARMDEVLQEVENMEREVLKEKKPKKKAAKKPKKKAAKKKDNNDEANFLNESFSLSKERLTQMLNEETQKKDKLVSKQYPLNQVKNRIKSSRNKKELYRFIIEVLSYKKSALGVQMSGERIGDSTSFYYEKLEDILTESFSEEDKSVLSKNLKRIEMYIDKFKKNMNSMKDVSEAEKVFMAEASVIIFEAVKKSISITGNVISTAASIINNTKVRGLIEAATGYNPFVSGMLELIGENLEKFSQRIQKNRDGAIEKDLEEITKFDAKQREQLVSDFNYDREKSLQTAITAVDNRDQQIKKAKENISPETSSEKSPETSSEKSPETSSEKSPETSSEKEGIETSSEKESLDDIQESQEEQIDILHEIADDIKENKETSQEQLQQNEEWKKEEFIQMSKDRISTKNKMFDKPQKVMENIKEKAEKSIFGKLIMGFFGMKLIGSLSTIALVIGKAAVAFTAAKTLYENFSDLLGQNSEKANKEMNERNASPDSVLVGNIAGTFASTAGNIVGIENDKKKLQERSTSVVESLSGILTTIQSALMRSDTTQQEGIYIKQLRKMEQSLAKEKKILGQAIDEVSKGRIRSDDSFKGMTVEERRKAVERLQEDVSNKRTQLEESRLAREKIRNKYKNLPGVPTQGGYFPPSIKKPSPKKSSGKVIQNSGMSISTQKKKEYDGLTPELRAKIEKYATEEGVDPDLAIEMIRQESNFRHGGVISSAGAYGYTQLMPDTAMELGVDRTDPDQNLRGGIRYLGQKLREFDGDERKALSGYNAGAGATRKANRRGFDIAQNNETRDYVSKITGRVAERRNEKAEKLANAGKKKEEMVLSKNDSANPTVINSPVNNVVNNGGGSSGGRRDSITTRNTESTHAMLQMHMMRGAI